MSAPLLAAVEHLAATLDGYTLHDVAPSLTCSEAEALAAVFAAAGRADKADAVLDFHALDDEDGDHPDHIARQAGARERQGLA